MNRHRHLWRSLIVGSLAIFAGLLTAGAASTSSPVQVTSINLAPDMDGQSVTTTSGQVIRVRHSQFQLCHMLVKSATRLSEIFGAEAADVQTDGEFCTADLYTEDVPDVMLRLPNAIVHFPDERKVRTRGQQCCLANEIHILWVNSQEGYFSVSLPPTIRNIKTPEDAAREIGGDPFCWRKDRDLTTDEHVFVYGRQCQGISFIVPVGWFADMGTHLGWRDLRSPGYLIPNARHVTLIRAATIMRGYLNQQ